MFRQYMTHLDATGKGSVEIRHNNAAMEWDIYQISVITGTMNQNCVAIIYVNGAFLCASPQGSLDTAIGPPDLVASTSDVIEVEWQLASAGDTATANIWYNENPAGMTYSAAH